MNGAIKWSDWNRVADHLSVGTNLDGRLEVFVRGNDGAVWHIWQVR